MNNVIVTGGSGSFGQAFVRELMAGDEAERIVIYSRGEHKQEEMRLALDPKQERLRFAIGDVRDYRRLQVAMRGIDTVVHAAALKVVPLAEYNPFEALKTNALGAANVVEAALHAGVETVVALGSDKGASPLNMYGATKLCAEKLFVAANAYGGLATRFTCTRYGNVTGSAGSVVPRWLALAGHAPLPVTSFEATRFWMTIDEAVALVLHATRHGAPGEVIVPNLPAYTVHALAEAIDPDGSRTLTGLRPGEKLHEVMVSADEAALTWLHHDGHYRIAQHGPEPHGEPLAGPLSSHAAVRLTVTELRARLAALGLVPGAEGGDGMSIGTGSTGPNDLDGGTIDDAT